jgi:hypothetical protein
MLWINHELLPSLGLLKKISIRTVYNWLAVLDYHAVSHKNGVYHDRHEAPDIVEERKQFVQQYRNLERRMIHYEGDQSELIMPREDQSSPEIVHCCQDESTCYANDGKRKIWVKKGEHALGPKGEGQSIMVSAILCPCHGHLSMIHEGRQLRSRESMECGTNREGWWRNINLIEQE